MDPIRWSPPPGWPSSWASRTCAVVDAHLVHAGRRRASAPGRVRAGHIPGAVFFDIDEIADHANPLPHMLPTPDDFADAVRRLGIGRLRPHRGL